MCEILYIHIVETEKAMAPHSSTLAWKIPWMEEPGRLQSMGSQRVWTWLSNFTFTFHFHALEKEMATHSSVLAWRIPGTGKPGGLLSMGSHRVGHDWSNLAEQRDSRKTHPHKDTYMYTSTFIFLSCIVRLFSSNGPTLKPSPDINTELTFILKRICFHSLDVWAWQPPQWQQCKLRKILSMFSFKRDL